MATNQLDTLYKYEHDKEKAMAGQLQQAEFEYRQHHIRLQSVAEYRLEYMKRLSERSIEGIDSATYNHYHAFIAKLDYANEQVVIAVSQAEALVKQTKHLWLRQRQKVQAVEILKEKARLKARMKADKDEQRMFDEMAIQQFVRRQPY